MFRHLVPLLASLLVACSTSPFPPPDDGGAPLPAPDLAPRFDLGPRTGDAVLADSEADLLPGAPRLRVALLDVGQGDALVLWLPGGAVLVVDGGPDREGAFAAFLQQEGITWVDYVLLSHPHADHYTGLPVAIARLPEGCNARVFDPGFDRMGVGGYRYFRAVAGCRYRAVRSGEALPLDPLAEVRVLSASASPFPDSESSGVNNTSVVLQVRYHNFSIILGGDAEVHAERALWERAGVALRSTVMKLGHHGSCDATGRTLLGAVAPQLALLSLGANNPFGHPHCQTMDKLRAHGGRWLRTDRNGTVRIITDGVRYVTSWARGGASDPACPRPCAAPVDF